VYQTWTDVLEFVLNKLDNCVTLSILFVREQRHAFVFRILNSLGLQNAGNLLTKSVNINFSKTFLSVELHSNLIVIVMLCSYLRSSDLHAYRLILSVFQHNTV
jgi:hypothetical protein